MQRIRSLQFWSIVLLLALALGAVGAISYARIVEGDMEAAGRGGRRASPVYAPPLDPSVKYAYSCRAELNDGLEYRERKIEVAGESKQYDLWAYADFTLDQDHRGMSSGELSWKWLAVVTEENPEEEFETLEIPLSAPPANAFSVANHGISLTAYATGEGKAPVVSLSGTVRLDIGNYFHAENGYAKGDLNSSELKFQVDASLNHRAQGAAGEPDQLWRRLYVRCTKRL
ncbi:MAG: hypothetical protein EOP11_21970 [Proteobacteria bacterium]|nr:MAG: hypothetical protein EOP11_21970 [Pseudomonadota bacterium]